VEGLLIDFDKALLGKGDDERAVLYLNLITHLTDNRKVIPLKDLPDFLRNHRLSPLGSVYSQPIYRR
jgi:hypothetical protein